MSENVVHIELSVLGTMMVEEEAVPIAIEALRAEDFSRETHRTIFRAVNRLFEDNRPVEVVTIAEELQRVRQLDKVGGRAQLAEIGEAATVVSKVEYFTQLIRDHSVRRQLTEKCTQIAQNAQDEGIDTATLVEEAEQAIYQITERHAPDQSIHIADIIGEVFDAAERAFKDPQYSVGIPTGFTDLDELICGLEPGTSYVIAGRPSMGKTALAINIAQNVAAKNHPVGIFSLEMPKRQLVLRMICATAKVNVLHFRSGRCSQKDFSRAVQLGSKVHDLPIYIDDTPALTPQQIKAKARRMKTRHGIELVIVDYLQLIRDPSAQNQEQQVANASAAMKALAKELDIPVIVLSQLNRASEHGREDARRPKLADLRYSGAIEQDADVVMFIYRPEQYNAKDKPGLAEILIRKQRNGPTGEVKLTFLKESARFVDYQHDDRPPGRT